MSGDGLINLSSLVPFESESRWSDTLTALARTDIGPLLACLGMAPDGDDAESGPALTVAREVPWDRQNLPDVVLMRGGIPWVVLVSKVLGDDSASRLARYQTTRPGAAAYVLLHPEVFGRRTPPHPWRALAWETLLDAFSRSTHPWVQATAAAWRASLDHAVPRLDADTRWDDVRELPAGSGIGAAVRARLAWLHARAEAIDGVDVDLHGSTGDNGWTLSLRAATGSPGYTVMVEIEEQLSARYFADPDAVPRGAAALVTLELAGVDSSRDFDWDYLLALWQVMARDRDDWATHPARPKAAHDLAGQRRIVGLGAPVFLGAGYGDKNAHDTGACQFGARIRFPADLTLGQANAEVGRLIRLASAMAATPRPERSAG